MNLNLTMIAQAITFSAFIWFTVKFVWPHMLRAIETRLSQQPDVEARNRKPMRANQIAHGSFESADFAYTTMA